MKTMALRLVSNDHYYIIEQLIEHFEDVRMRCPYCPRKFISSWSITNHIRRGKKKNHSGMDSSQGY